MEIKANHVLIGAFTLASVIAAFFFLVWLGQFSFERQFTTYEIYFEGGVSGLEKAAEVRYSGIKVGEVTDVELDKDDPRRVKVTVRIQAGTPIKEDTVATIDTGLLTGVGTVQLSGGSPNAPLLTAKPGQVHPVIAAKLTGIQELAETAPNLLAAASSLLARGNALLNDRNRQAVADILQNVKRITEKTDAILADVKMATARLDRISENLDAFIADLRTKGGPALADIQAMAAELQGALAEIRPGLRDFARNGLNQATAFFAEARAAIAAIGRVAAKLESNPSGFFFGSEKPDYKGGGRR